MSIHKSFNWWPIAKEPGKKQVSFGLNLAFQITFTHTIHMTTNAAALVGLKPLRLVVGHFVKTVIYLLLYLGMQLPLPAHVMRLKPFKRLQRTFVDSLQLATTASSTIAI